MSKRLQSPFNEVSSDQFTPGIGINDNDARSDTDVNKKLDSSITAIEEKENGHASEDVAVDLHESAFELINFMPRTAPVLLC